MRPTGTADLAQSVILQDDVADGSQSFLQLRDGLPVLSIAVLLFAFAAGTLALTRQRPSRKDFAGSVDIGLAPSAAVGLREAPQPIAARQTVFVLATRAEWGHRYPLHQLGPGFG